jgi:hypothetical protein
MSWRHERVFAEVAAVGMEISTAIAELDSLSSDRQVSCPEDIIEKGRHALATDAVLRNRNVPVVERGRLVGIVSTS